MKRPWWRIWQAPSATRRRPQGGLNKSTTVNFESMKLRKRERYCDPMGTWWVKETRQDHATGLILSRTRRITD